MDIKSLLCVTSVVNIFAVSLSCVALCCKLRTTYICMTHGKATNRNESCMFWGAGDRNVAQVTMSNDLDTTISSWGISWVKLLKCWRNGILKSAHYQLSSILNGYTFHFVYNRYEGHWMGVNKATK